MDAPLDSCHYTCRNDLAELPRVNAQLQQFIDGKGIPPQATYALELAMEELMTNIIKYGHDDGADHTIQIRIDLSPEHVVLTVEDDGFAFNPLENQTPDTTKLPEERKIGGLGLHMVREMSEQMEYRREGDYNITVVHIRRA